MRKRLIFSQSALIQLSTVGLLIMMWLILTPHFVSERTLPSPESVFKSAQSLHWALLAHASSTLVRVLLGWALGASLGFLVGLVMNVNRILYNTINPLIEIVRPIPPVALIPFFIIWLGLGPTSQILLTALASFMVLVVTTYGTVSNVPILYLQAATVLGATKTDLYMSVIIPWIIPHLLSGLRVAAGTAFAVGVAAEFIGAQSGIGFLIMVARRTLNTDTILLGVVLLGLMSYALDLSIRTLQTVLCPWAENSEDYLYDLGRNPISEILKGRQDRRKLK